MRCVRRAEHTRVDEPWLLAWCGPSGAYDTRPLLVGVRTTARGGASRAAEAWPSVFTPPLFIMRFCFERCAHANIVHTQDAACRGENRFDSRRLHQVLSYSDLEVPVSGSGRIWAPTSRQSHRPRCQPWDSNTLRCYRCSFDFPARSARNTLCGVCSTEFADADIFALTPTTTTHKSRNGRSLVSAHFTLD